MYRVFLIPTDEFSQKELWLDAYTVRESDCSDYWDFVDPEDRLIRRLAKIGVKAFEVTPDRRKPRPIQASILEDILSGVGASMANRL